MADLQGLRDSKARGKTDRKATKKSVTGKATNKGSSKPASQSGVINLRASHADRDLFDRAAAVAGQNRTEFMLHSARIHAEHVLLSQVYFQVDEAAWDEINDALLSSPPANAALKAAFKRVPLWNKS